MRYIIFFFMGMVVPSNTVSAARVTEEMRVENIEEDGFHIPPSDPNGSVTQLGYVTSRGNPEIASQDSTNERHTAIPVYMATSQAWWTKCKMIGCAIASTIFIGGSLFVIIFCKLGTKEQKCF